MVPTPGPDFKPLVQEVARLGGDLAQVWPQLDERLRPVLGYDSSTFSTIDPSTLLWTTRSVIGIDSGPARERKALELEFRGDDLNSFPNLLMQQMPIGNLHTTSGGNLAKSIRYDSLLVLKPRPGRRGAGRRPLRGPQLGHPHPVPQASGGAVRLPRTAVPRDALEPFGELLRLRMLQWRRSTGHHRRPPGLIQVSADGQIDDISPAAAARMETLGDPAAAATAVAEVVAAFNGDDALAHVTLPTGEETSVTFHTSVGADGNLAVVVEEDRIVVLDQRIADHYKFTEDEVEILPFYAQGRTTRTIAQILTIDAFTIQDWLISMFAKTGTKNRADFLATIYASHFEERFAAAVRPSPYGFFVE